MNLRKEIVNTIAELKKRREFKNQAEIANFLNYNASYFSRTLNSEDIPIDFEEKFFKAFPKSKYLKVDDFLSHVQDPEPRINPTLKEVQLKLKKVKENKQKTILPNAQPNIETDKFKVVKLIPEKVAMGLLSNFFDSEYVDQLETELIEVDDYFTEDAYKVDSVGESMNDGTARSLLDGDKFLAKDIPRAKWGDKLINGSKNLFYILHSERGHMIKEITAHDISDKKLTLHSWNKDKKLYPDFEIHTNHCYIIASIQELLSRKMSF